MSEGSRNHVISNLKNLVESMIAPVSSRLQRSGMIAHADPSTTNIYTLRRRREALQRARARSALFTDHLRSQIESDIRDLRHMIECRRLVGNTDLAGLNHLFQSMTEVGVGQVMSAIADTPQFKKISETLRKTQNDASALMKSAPKIAKLKEILALHFKTFPEMGPERESSYLQRYATLCSRL